MKHEFTSSCESWKTKQYEDNGMKMVLKQGQRNREKIMKEAFGS